MKGLELAQQYYAQYGKEMLQTQFPEIMPLLAIGLAGSGSECYGYDDETSRDHDFEPCFCLLLPGENIVDRRTAFLLERAYAKLPGEFKGFRRTQILPVGGARHGVLRTEEVFQNKTGTPDGDLTLKQWLSLPDHYLAEAVNGEIFYDGYGEVTRIRRRLAFYPEDIRRKKLAGHLLLMAQAGQYNYLRSVRRGENAAAQMAVFEYVKSGIEAVFLLNRKYQPYYKWAFRAMRELPVLPDLADDFEMMITRGNDEETAREKSAVIERISRDVIRILEEQRLSSVPSEELERHAYIVNDSISDSEIRNLHVLAGV